MVANWPISSQDCLPFLNETDYFIWNAKYICIFNHYIFKRLQQQWLRKLFSQFMDWFLFPWLCCNSFTHHFYINYTSYLYETLPLCPSITYMYANSSLMWTCICSYYGYNRDVWGTFVLASLQSIYIIILFLHINIKLYLFSHAFKCNLKNSKLNFCIFSHIE